MWKGRTRTKPLNNFINIMSLEEDITGRDTKAEKRREQCEKQKRKENINANCYYSLSKNN